MKTLKYSIIFLTVMAGLTSCADHSPKVQDTAIVRGGLAVSNDTSEEAVAYVEDKLSSTTAELVGVISMEKQVEIYEYGLYYSKVENFSLGEAKKVNSTNLGQLGDNISSNSFSVLIDGLTDNTKYYYRYFVSHSGGVSYSELSPVNSFTTTPVYSIPSVVVKGEPVIDFNRSIATVTCVIEETGYQDISECGIYYGTSEDNITEKLAYESLPEVVDNNFSYDITLSSLVNGNTYYYQAYAVNEKGESKSDIRSFIFTKPLDLPILSIVGNVEITGKETAEVTFKLDSKGEGDITDYGYYLQGSKVPVGTSLTGDTYTAQLTGLRPATIYEIYPYAVNEDGESVKEGVTVVSFKSAIIDKYDPNIYYVELPGIEVNGKVYRFLDRNLGSVKRYDTYEVPENDHDAGWYIQWGRNLDGHQISNSPTVALPKNGQIKDISQLQDEMYKGKFITGAQSNYMWFDKGGDPGPEEWWNNSATGGINNPCPEGYRVPTLEEMKIFWEHREELYVPMQNYFRASGSGAISTNDGNQSGWYWCCDFNPNGLNQSYLKALKIKWSNKSIVDETDFKNNAAGLLVRPISINTAK